ncbi:Rub1p activation mediating protein [Komagataella phaffii CBS 7435]|uniref:NEDD8-activating enzyme E1 catalytic subunit n=2 Tax=Komagataella phaffii TaxID=460519 RepID=C4QZT5_KOMPG|nr:Protein that acts together with Ula1p to activate Rub1p before its conjugation to proteins (neddylat [Komagataella phaffii GS115]AOA62743.1 GQ67_00178T0 [Komagataella phaffii]CAH2448743.1 Rub1p activation mediating protein [Komagataella phaffii CBS 7435]AOA67815.1 GQ68_01210T0 [Komagataella phaffii GS115]CAY68759.1 Protein that acts together with Ula1p to activate Rub1p before its conjugation to proteins (neddylat [Komagataella phaffii GS115]CCA38834.1 Rub1p activation mediating protein [Ko
MSINSIKPFTEKKGPFTDDVYEPNTEETFNAIRSSKILVIGAGGLGCEILKNLSLSGFQDIHVIDMDTIDLTNLNRQFLFRNKDIGKSKAKVASQFVMNRIPNVQITPHFCRIQDKDDLFYRQFQLVICGLDSTEARRWINHKLVTLLDPNDFSSLIPMIDGGTEGFRGQSRLILPTLSSCFECSLDMIPTNVTYPVCTIANTPRLPEHCIEWAHQLEWPKKFGDKPFDADDPSQVDWMYKTSLERAKHFDIEGVTLSLTLGVVKNIIPAISSTNAIIAASCCNEALKLISNVNPILDNYMMYSGDESVFTYTFKHERKPSCPVCGGS